MRFALLLGIGVLALAGCGGGDDTYLRTGKFDLAWRHLHPEQKKIVSSATLASCWTSTTDVLGDPNVRMNVVEVFDEPWRIPGTGLTRPSKAVTVDAC